ncbi:flagellar hook-associated protein FlgK [Ferrimicrobium acidiphilum]|uniref:flagellar hook-associated protein FlgK n=1 Tax=Ferrimicrobium acidiphilum TaxID=121039 RepID=UPI0023F4A206|nr:flagellar hook-associated protein FlgK [Ferrimicrobium acidiphilum]
MSGGSLSIALSGLNAAQTGLDTVSENISNANTPGYLKETASLANQQTPGDAIGNGVTVTGVVQSSNSFNRQLELSANGAQSYANQIQSLLTSAQASFNEPSSNGIAEQMNTLYNNFSALADNPTQASNNAQVVASAQNVATSINQAAANLSAVYNQASSSASTMVETINSQLQQVASINTQLASTSLTPGASNTLVDQQNQVIDKLASEIGVTSIPGTAGQTTLLIGGVSLVQGGQVSAIKLSTQSQTSPPSTSGLNSVVLESSPQTTVPVMGGTLGATLQVMNTNLPKYGSYLNTLATTLASQVNDQLQAGQTSQGSYGKPLFFFSGNATAATLGVYANTLIAASGSKSYAAGDGSNAQAIANQQTATDGAMAGWASSVASVGLDVQSAAANASNATNTYNQAYTAEKSVSGVAVNSQLVNLVNYQQVYQAAAKVISTVAATLQSLIQDV